jgi:hypothetical protein
MIENPDVKLVYVKRWRTIVPLPAKYADEIVEALRIDPAATSWKPIETAPQSGEVLLWWNNGAGVSVGWWDDENEGWRNEGDDCVPKNQSNCTHWMPKPAGPLVSRPHRGTVK